MTITLPNLIAAGFHRAGTWQACQDPNTQGMAIDFNCAREPGLYAFVVADQVRYVGSAQRGLRGRFRRYATTQTMRTSARVRSEVLRCLEAGESVEIYTLTPPKLEWNGLPVDLIMGLEEALIRNIRPAWNRRSNRA